MLHSALALILTLLVSGPDASTPELCVMPRIHYTADTVFVYADRENPLVLRARIAEPVAVTTCSMCRAGHCEHSEIAPPADSGTIVLSDVTVRGKRSKSARFFTGPNH
jgi:hypothetical protein